MTVVEEGIDIPDGAFAGFSASSVHATAIQIAPINQDFSLVFTSPTMGEAKVDGARMGVAKMVPVASLMVSAQGLKDLSLLLAKALADYEAEWGTVETVSRVNSRWKLPREPIKRERPRE